MAESSYRHAAHQVPDGIVFGAGLHIARHNLTDRFAQHCRSMFGQRPHNIALGQDTDDTVIGAKDDHRADVSLSNFTAAARLAVGSIVTTSRSLAAKMFL